MSTNPPFTPPHPVQLGMNRRPYLGTIVTATVTSLAGCSSPPVTVTDQPTFNDDSVFKDIDFNIKPVGSILPNHLGNDIDIDVAHRHSSNLDYLVLTINGTQEDHEEILTGERKTHISLSKSIHRNEYPLTLSVVGVTGGEVEEYNHHDGTVVESVEYTVTGDF